jgi:uncharacterized protein (TIGR02271 family)
MSTTDEVLTWRGRQLRSSYGQKLGTIEEIYLDAETNKPEWALITTGMFGTKRSFVPLCKASRSSDGVTVPFEKATVREATRIDPDGQLSQREEAELYCYYGLQYSDNQSPSGPPERAATPDGAGDVTDRSRDGRDEDAAGTVGRDESGPTSDDAMTRSEEQLRVGTRERESGRVRLHKYVVEDEVTQTVPVRREEVRVEREPITDANAGDAMSGSALSQEEHVLHEDEPVTDKRVVPKERVRLDKDATETEKTVSQSVGKEQIDVTGADAQPAEDRDGVRGTDSGVAR